MNRYLEMLKKVVNNTPKDLKRAIFAVFFVLLITIASFGIGRVSVLEGSRRPVKIIESRFATSTIEEKPEKTTIDSQSQLELEKNKANPVTSSKGSKPASSTNTDIVNTMEYGGHIIGVKTSKKYYFPFCGTIKRLKEENAVVFKSIEEARSAGYLPAKNCKGLQ